MADTTATADTGDTACAPHTGTPAVALGRGCGGGGVGSIEATATDQVCVDETVTEVPGTAEGGGCGCTMTGPMPSLAWLVLAYALLRRGVLVGLLCLVPIVANAQVDAQRPTVDGGDWLLLQEPELGVPWTGAASLSLNHGRELSRVVGGPEGGPKLQRVTTQQLDVSAMLGSWVRVGFALPNHTRIVFADSPRTRVWGDTSLWVAIPLTEADDRAVEDRGLSGTFAIRTDLPTGAPEVWLGGPGAVHATFAVGGPLGPFRVNGTLGGRFQAPIALPGVVWGNSLQWGLGMRVDPWGPLFVAAEGAGRTPVRFYAGEPQDYASELIGVVGVRPGGVLSVSAGAGAGTAQGVGSPGLRVLGALDLRPRTLPDRDADGLADLRDLCPSRPEDVDGFRDADGCPDEDNDQDGIADVTDDCPMVPENPNGVEDFDGCPELATRVSVVVQTAGDADVVTVVLGEEAVQSFPGEPVEQLVRELEVEVTGRAPRHREVTQTVELAGRDAVVVELVLPEQDYGWLEVVASGPEGPLEAVASVEEQVLDGVTELPAGTVPLHVEADGYLPVDLKVLVPVGETLRLPITLTPTGVRVDGDRLEVGDRTTFAVNEAEVADDDPALLHVLAWLRAHDEVELLRVEGHADGQGSSRYNYELSQKRAEAVVAWLVGRGIAGERLQAVGSGEALAAEADAEESRRVGFLVLVWRDDDQAAKGDDGP